MVEVARAASFLGHVQGVDAFPFARGDDQGGLPDGPVGVGLAILVEDELRGELLACDGVAVGAGRFAGKRLQHDALHVAGVAGGGVAEGEKHVPTRVAGEVGVGEAVNLRTPRAADAVVAERLHGRVEGAVVGDGLRAIGRRKAGERVGGEHVHLRGAGLREVEPVPVAEEPRVGAAFPEERRIERFDSAGERARAGKDDARGCDEAFHAVIVPRMRNLCKCP